MGTNIYVAGGFVQKARDHAEHHDNRIKRSRLKEAVIQTANWVSSCEKYDLKEQKWSNCPYVFPPISITLDSYGVSSELLNATVSGDEKIAIITCKEEFNSIGDDIGRMIISFTEKDGFNVHDEDSYKTLRGKRVVTVATKFENPIDNGTSTRISLCLD